MLFYLFWGLLVACAFRLIIAEPVEISKMLAWVILWPIVLLGMVVLFIADFDWKI